jgi:hypothetical protein
MSDNQRGRGYLEILGVGEMIILKYLSSSYRMWRFDMDSSGIG